MGSFFDSFVGSVVYSRLLLPFVFVFCGTQLLEHIVIFVFQLGPEPVTAPQHLVSRLRRLFHMAGDIRCKPGPGSALSLYRATSHRSNVRHTCTCCVRLLYPDRRIVVLVWHQQSIKNSGVLQYVACKPTMYSKNHTKRVINIRIYNKGTRISTGVILFEAIVFIFYSLEAPQIH